jgi:acetoin utilization deacetylase AcuC-like enzyme
MSSTITHDNLGGNNATRKSKVSYYFDEEFSVYQVSPSHPMKPLRIKMTDTLVKSYGMDQKMTQIEVREEYVQDVDLTLFHSDDYVDCLRNLSIAKKDHYVD